MNDKQRSEVEYIVSRRPDVDFKISERGNQVVLQGKGEKQWPDITVGRRGGVQVWVRSYDEHIKSAREWALEADDLLAKQMMRDSKKICIDKKNEHVLLENYDFFALAYLNDWWQYDRSFVKGLQPSNNRKIRLYWLKEAAAYYQVIRNFAEEYDKGERLGKALDALDELKDPITSDNINTNVNTLAALFKSSYKQNLLSAASKFLWIRYKSPVVIYDDRARRGLKLVARIKRLGTGYSPYRETWLKLFEKYTTGNSAHDGLSILKDYAPSDSDKAELESILGTDWFRERVFDKFLWWNGRSDEEPE